MSELETEQSWSARRTNFLTSVCYTALLASVCWPAKASENGDHPLVWVELGGQLERNNFELQPFVPPFAQSFAANGLPSAVGSQRQPLYSNGAEASLAVTPLDSDWIFSASILYGRSNASAASHGETNNPAPANILIVIPALGVHFSNVEQPMSRRLAENVGREDESRAVLDFQAGRDVGLGILGQNSIFSLGVRFAQFMTRSEARITADVGPHWHYKYQSTDVGYPATVKVPEESWDIYHAKALISRSFRGAGPSLGLNGSARLLGNTEGMQVGFDWGARVAILFGRQKVKVHGDILDQEPLLPHPYNFIPLTTVYHHTPDRTRSRTVIVPNLGGFAGLSFNYANAKLKFGYRADFFFSAMDGGIDIRKTENVGFYGPFATISVGLGG
ncbi:MAG TPA: hypothetical protein VK779_01450 [Rhizomicrobium sp.]|jgi:hypothetical protein|nr:hypothetical protein [Rhizomicrobium sp.]